jgi:c-di-GMP-binding flagellar brake protein YcgR
MSVTMAAWLSKVVHALTSFADPYEAVRPTLHAAQKARAKILLELISRSESAVMNASIEQVRGDDVVISQPMIGGHTYPLAFGESLRINFMVDGVTYTGQSRCLGRIKIPAGQTGPGRSQEQLIFAYRLAMPLELKSDDQRAQPRVQLDFTVPIEAQLYAPGTMHGPMLGRLADISMGGARVITPMQAMWMFPGQSVYLKAMLPEPVGLIDELVDIARIETDETNGARSIGIRFRKRLPGLEDLIRRKRIAA